MGGKWNERGGCIFVRGCGGVEESGYGMLIYESVRVDIRESMFM